MRKKDIRWLNFVKPLIVFVCCALIATAIELVASYLLEAATGAWSWQTYASYKYNFQARIALPTSLRFGLGGTIFLYVVQPFFDWLLGKPKEETLGILAWCVLAVVLCDCTYTLFLK